MEISNDLFILRNPGVKTVNQQLIESMNTRQVSYSYSISKETENMFLNNVRIIETQNMKPSSSIKLVQTKSESYVNETQMQPQSNTIKNKIDNIMQNHEKERESQIDEINELNSKLFEKTSIHPY